MTQGQPEASTSTSTSTPKIEKLGGYDFYRKLGSPKYIVAPMVDQSELAFRRLCRQYGAQLIYTPMINAKMFTDPVNKSYRASAFDIASGEEGDMASDRPLIVQFCANDPDQLLQSAKVVEKYCDAVDINLGCPQDIAKRGRYGSFLQDDWPLIYSMINTLHVNLSIPVTAKFRVFPDVEKTVEYAKMLERAGAQILTCHGRIREQRGQNTGLADWSKIRAVKEAVKVPVFANGNILFQDDIARCLEETGCDGVMSAEGILYNPALFYGLDAPSSSPKPPTTDLYPMHTTLASQYLSIVLSLKTKTPVSAVKGHLFKLMRPALTRELDLRERLGRTGLKPGKGGDADSEGKKGDKWLRECVAIVEEMRVRMERDAKEATKDGTIPLEDLVTTCPKTGLRLMPHWVAQPYFRPLPVPQPPQEKAKRKKKRGGAAKEVEVEEVKVVEKVGEMEQETGKVVVVAEEQTLQEDKVVPMEVEKTTATVVEEQNVEPPPALKSPRPLPTTAPAMPTTTPAKRTIAETSPSPSPPPHVQTEGAAPVKRRRALSDGEVVKVIEVVKAPA
ncbi:tRNA-dihydrouridine synthase 1 [Coprinopsis cinerea AmutBmut pab1-1]|nr:tRNA-dihydrouridine synthase 1 [Coprinopsis cinerea AmutBmut pab1-1]